jgi:GT2 family glycosyltransferase
MERALVLCVNYASDAETAAFVRACLELEGSEHVHVVVVDNSGSFEGPPDLASRDGWSVVRPPENLGYFGGAAAGFEEYLREAAIPEWVVVSNTDIEFPDPQFFTRLWQRHPHGSAIIAPCIFSPIQERDQNPFMRTRPPRARLVFYLWLGRHPWAFVGYVRMARAKQRIWRWACRSGPRRAASDTPFPIYAPHGSLVIFPRRYFEAGGTLRHGAFLYHEELFVAESGRQHDVPVLYDPALKVIHREHATTRHMLTGRRLVYFREANNFVLTAYFPPQKRA